MVCSSKRASEHRDRDAIFEGTAPPKIICNVALINDDNWIVLTVNCIITYFPIASSKYLEGDVAPRLVSGTWATSPPRDLFRIACRRPCGAISITRAFLGMLAAPS